jgi:hypothetical protein
MIGYNTKGPDSGNSNIIIGADSGGAGITSGSCNALIGVSAGGQLTTGTLNIAIGHDAGICTTTGSCNISLGYKAATNATGSVNTIQIGMGDGINKFPGGSDNTIKMGKRTANICNNFASNATWVHSSDLRYKKDIQDNTIGLDFINALRTVNYKWKAQSELDSSLDEYDSSKITADSTALQHGLIAQEVKQVMDDQGISPDFAGWSEDETHPNNKQGISEAMFVYPLIKAIQELKSQNEDLKSRIEVLENS